MSETTVRVERVRWPWVVFAFSAASGVAGLVFLVLKGDELTGDIVNFIAFMSMGVVGALILSRDRRNLIGGLLLWAVTSIAIAFAANEAAGYLYEQGSTTLAAWVGWPGSTLWMIGFFPLLVFLPLLFPDGKVPSPRWRVPAWIGLAWCFLAFLAVGFADDVVASRARRRPGEDVELPNPLHIPGLDFPTPSAGDVDRAAGSVRPVDRRDDPAVPPVDRDRATAAAVVLVRRGLPRGVLHPQLRPRGRGGHRRGRSVR